MNWGLIFLSLLLFPVSSFSDDKIFKGELVTVKTWSPLNRLCFGDDEIQEFSYHILYPVSHATQEILLYTAEQWDMVYKSQKDCAERAAIADPHNNQVIALNDSDTLTSRHSGCKLIDRGGSEDYECNGTQYFGIHTRSQCWFLAVARCSTSADHVLGLMMTYYMHSNATGPVTTTTARPSPSPSSSSWHWCHNCWLITSSIFLSIFPPFIYHIGDKCKLT